MKQHYKDIKLNYKTRLMIIDKHMDFAMAFKKLLPDLKKAGSNWKCCSPFQDEKTPSFVVSPRKHLWHCFSSGKGGNNVVSFIAKKNNMRFSEALDWVETRFGLNRTKRNTKTMLTAIQMLNENEQQKQLQEPDDSYKRSYEDTLLKLIKNFQKKANDECQVLNPIIEYIWEMFDENEFETLDDFNKFMKWAYKLLSYFLRKTINPLHSFKNSFVTAN